MKPYCEKMVTKIVIAKPRVGPGVRILRSGVRIEVTLGDSDVLGTDVGTTLRKT